MKINGSTSASPLSGVSSSGAPVRGAKAAPQSRASSANQDSVTLSSVSSQIKALENGIAEASSFDAAKVSAIKQAISEGRFSINPELIADKLIASAKELASQQRG